MTRKIITAGGGASALMAAIMAARAGAQVTVLEQNQKIGQKLLASGSGKCNLSNTGSMDGAYRGKDPSFAGKVLAHFTREDTRSFFTDLGILMIEHDHRLYPYTELSTTVLHCLMAEASRLGVKMKTGEHITDISPKDSGFQVSTDTWSYLSDAVILCCGSSASDVTGACDDGLTFARKFGHTAEPFTPALTYLKSSDKICAGWGGVRAYGSVLLLVDGQIVYRTEGQLQLINGGISGIPVFQLSRFASEALRKNQKVTVILDFINDEGRMLLEKQAGRSASEAAWGLFPDKLARILTQGVDNVEELSRKAGSFELNISSAGNLKQSQAASGGVSTAEVDPSSCESRLHKGLYICGEMLDIDGDCGGWNLQFAWSTGALAGGHAAKNDSDQ